MGKARHKVWITRTEPGATESAKKVKRLGFDPVIAPLLKISPPDHMPSRPEPDALIVFTSKNGVDAFCTFTDRRDWRVVTVGDATAQHAQTLGFENVTSADGTSEDVAALIHNTIPTSTLIYHAAGQHVRGQVCEDLRRIGYKAQREIFYQSSAITGCPNIDMKSLSSVLLYSPQAAQTFAHFIPEMDNSRHNLTLISISQATDDALGTQSNYKKLIAAKPTEAAMFDQLKQA